LWRGAGLASRDLDEERGPHPGRLERSALVAAAGGDDAAVHQPETCVLRAPVDLLGQLREERVETLLVEDWGDGAVGRGLERDERREALAGHCPLVIAARDHDVGSHAI